MCRGGSASQGALVSVAVSHKSLPIYDVFVGKPDTLSLCISSKKSKKQSYDPSSLLLD